MEVGVGARWRREHRRDDWVFGVAAADAAGHESTISAYVTPPRNDGGSD